VPVLILFLVQLPVLVVGKGVLIYFPVITAALADQEEEPVDPQLLLALVDQGHQDKGFLEALIPLQLRMLAAAVVVQVRLVQAGQVAVQVVQVVH
jgi:hypothetical protein